MRRTSPRSPRLQPRLGALIVVAIAMLAACSGAAPTAAPSASGPRPSAVAAGAHTSVGFSPAATFTLPAGWEIPTDTATYLQLRPLGDEVVGIHVFRDPVALSQASACPSATEPGVTVGAVGLGRWIRERPGLVVGPPGLATIGGLPGTMLDVRIKDGWKESCPFANGLPTVPLFFQPPDGYHWVVAGSERLRLYLFDLPGGGTLLLDIDAFDGSRMDDFVKAASPIVASFSFAKS